jgi:FtsZ-interacting cell division protein ZipA
MQPLRWILLLAGVLFLAALAWWESRRPRQASGDSRLRGEHREPTLNEAALAGLDSLRTPQAPLPIITVDAVPAGELSPAVGPTSPASSDADASAAASSTALEATESAVDNLQEGVLGPARTLTPAAQVGADGSAAATHDGIPTLAALPDADLVAAPPLVVEWPSDGRILSVRLVPPADQRFSGRALRQALAALGFVHGRFGIFHQPDLRGRAVLSAASLVRPGLLDPETMDFQRFPGVNVFAVLPGPLRDIDALEHLLGVAHELLERTGGRLQDDRGGPLDAACIAHWRSELSGAGVADEPAANEALSGQPAEPAA